MNNRYGVFLALFAYQLGLVSCGGNGKTDDGAGPCVHEFRDHVIHIESAIGQSKKQTIAVIALSSFAVDGYEYSGAGEKQFLNGLFGDHYSVGMPVNAVLNGTVVLCTLPCSFGVTEGSWEFLVSADGHIPSIQIIDAAYGSFGGGCPSWSDDGTHVSLILPEETTSE